MIVLVRQQHKKFQADTPINKWSSESAARHFQTTAMWIGTQWASFSGRDSSGWAQEMCSYLLPILLLSMPLFPKIVSIRSLVKMDTLLPAMSQKLKNGYSYWRCPLANDWPPTINIIACTLLEKWRILTTATAHQKPIVMRHHRRLQLVGA